MKLPHKLNDEHIKAIQVCLDKEDRAEVIPTKEGVLVMHIKRERVKTKDYFVYPDTPPRKPENSAMKK